MDPSAFERLPASFSRGTSKLLSRDDVRAELGDDRAGDFIGRLASVFGPPDRGGEFVFRHRATGLVITAYSAQSGPSYGGGPRITGALPQTPPKPDHSARLAAQQARDTAALAKLTDDKAQLEIELFDRRRPAAERARVHRARRELARAISELRGPPGFYGVAEELETLLAAKRPADYQVIDDSSDFGPRWVGVRDGEAFDDPMSFDEAMSHYLGLIDDRYPAAAGLHAIRLFFHFDGGPPAARRRWSSPVRDAWLKLLAMVEQRAAPDDLASLRELLGEFADKLEIPAEARARLERA